MRCAIRLMHTRDRWEGTPAQLLEDLCMTGAAPIDGTPKQVTDELVKWQEMLYERESLILKRGRSHNGRFVKIEKIRTDGF